MATRTISPKALYELHQSGKAVEVIDVRTPAEYRECHATIARLEPLDRLDPARVVASRNLKDEPLYVVCRSGARGQKACDLFAAAGLGDVVVNVEGGTLAWDAAGLPVARGKKAMSLERQVRIAAGSLVFLGTLLGVFVHPYFLGVPAFVGAGLVFAGVTDTCAMGMMIAKMPWNQASGAAPTCPT